MDHQQHDITNGREGDGISKKEEEEEDIFLSLPKGGEGWGIGELYQYRGAWLTRDAVKSVMAYEQDFRALNTDVMIATLPRSGTLWLKSLAYAVVNRTRYPVTSSSSTDDDDKLKHPLLTTSPHDLIPFLEFKHLYDPIRFPNHLAKADHDDESYPRLLSTHVPYICLPESVKDTNCKIVYMCRDPKDQFVSLWDFLGNKWRPILYNKKHVDVDPLQVEETFDMYCDGVSVYGSFWDHVLGYWKESLERPKKILFLKYENMKKEPRTQVKKLAEFLGYPFSTNEESEGVIDELIKLCSFDKLKNLDVKTDFNAENRIFFRKGEVGDWKNFLTPLMADRLDRIIEDKLHGSALVFGKI